MESVTRRIKNINQPIGGYINIRDFEVIELKRNEELNNKENIPANIIGMVVDYLARFSLGETISKSFEISLLGAKRINDLKQAEKIASGIKGLDDDSIINGCKLATYDVIVRAGPIYYNGHQKINPDIYTCENIRYMVKRTMSFFNIYGPVVLSSFTFEGAYTYLISSGDGDYLTMDTLWDVKVISANPKKEHTLQLLVYYLMGMKSKNNDFFRSVKYLGIFNPRLNLVYRIEISKIPNETIKEVSQTVIGYD